MDEKTLPAVKWSREHIRVNRAKLRQLIAALETAAAALRDEIESDATPDPFAVHVYRSRQECRRVEAHDTKSGKRSETFAITSYQQAQALGFKGGMPNWQAILWAPLPD